MNIYFEKLNNSLNDAIRKKYPRIRGQITQEDIDRLNDDFMEEVHEYDITETMDRKKSLDYHYRRHVLKNGEQRKSYNRDRYDYMTKSDYYTYAKKVAVLTPTYLITTAVTDKEQISEIIDDYESDPAGVMVIDYNLIDKDNGRPMYAVFNRKSSYSKYQEVCLVDTLTKEPITIFILIGGRFNKFMNDFLGVER